jgi:UTP-glucose-1-phosphate uridylyltransferase
MTPNYSCLLTVRIQIQAAHSVHKLVAYVPSIHSRNYAILHTKQLSVVQVMSSVGLCEKPHRVTKEEKYPLHSHYIFKLYTHKFLCRTLALFV